MANYASSCDDRCDFSGWRASIDGPTDRSADVDRPTDWGNGLRIAGITDKMVYCVDGETNSTTMNLAFELRIKGIVSSVGRNR